MGIAIRGEFQYTGPRLARAIQRAQAATRGSCAQKEGAGLGVLRKHLGDNAPETLATSLARACLSRRGLEETEQLFAGMDTEQRKAFLLKLLTPHFVSRPVLFDAPIGEATEADQTIEASELAAALEPHLPKNELILVANDTAGKGKLIGEAQVTNAQWDIFMAQTGHRAPNYSGLDDTAVVGVDYTNDAKGFASWLGMRALGKEEFLAAKKAGILQANKPWDWTSEKDGNYQVSRSVRNEDRLSNRPDNRLDNRLAFRVAQG